MNQGRFVVWATMAMVVLSMAFVSTGAARTGEEDPGPVFHEMNPGSFLVFPLFDVRPDYETQIRMGAFGDSYTP